MACARLDAAVGSSAEGYDACAGSSWGVLVGVLGAPAGRTLSAVAAGPPSPPLAYATPAPGA